MSRTLFNDFGKRILGEILVHSQNMASPESCVSWANLNVSRRSAVPLLGGAARWTCMAIYNHIHSTKSAPQKSRQAHERRAATAFAYLIRATFAQQVGTIVRVLVPSRGTPFRSTVAASITPHKLHGKKRQPLLQQPYTRETSVS
jgi:hypothetical protein